LALPGDPSHRKYALEHLDSLVVKAVGESGGHGMLIGPHSTAREREPTPLLLEFARDIDVARQDDPLTAMRRTAAEVFTRLEYSPRSTRVDSPHRRSADREARRLPGFAHIFIALARHLGVPCRYVSGYLFHEAGCADRSGEGATHAWAEVLLPDCGWIGIDPTNNIMVGERHIRIAFGRDYADVPPTRGVYTGLTAVRSELAVSVRVGPVHQDIGGEALSFLPWMSRDATSPATDADRS
jgi:transglutaminase-like putative cysteine protease